MRVLVGIILLTCVGCSTDNKIPLDSDLFGEWKKIADSKYSGMYMLHSSHGKFTEFEGEQSAYGSYYVVENNIVYLGEITTFGENKFNSSNWFITFKYSIQNDTLTLSGDYVVYSGKWVKSNVKSNETIQPIH